MIDINNATEQELRRFLRANGELDFEFVNHIHPESQKLRDAGFNEQADIMDDLYKKQTMKSMGWRRVLELEEVKAKAKQLQERLNAQQQP